MAARARHRAPGGRSPTIPSAPHQADLESQPVGPNTAEKAILAEFEVLRQRTVLDILEETVFGVRRQHWREEKDFLTERFTHWLLEEHLPRLGVGLAQVTLVVDSGSTLVPIFRHLARAIGDFYPAKSEVAELQIITNNFAGALLFQEEAVTHRTSRFAETISPLLMMPGRVVAQYSALVDDTTTEFLLRQREAQANRHFVALVTGNWIWVDPHGSPVPLVRNPSHRDIKSRILESADDRFVIAPLGKVLLGHDWPTIEGTLQTASDHPYGAENRSYARVDIDGGQTPPTLVTTSRPPGLILSPLSARLSNAVPSERLLTFPFDRLPTDESEQLAAEFPHASMRGIEMRRKLFHVEADDPREDPTEAARHSP